MNPVRSMLFTPGNRLDMIEKAAVSGTDAVIVDLEDAVSVDNKPIARSNLAELPPSPVPYYVRTNAESTGLLWPDLEAAGPANVVGIVLPKAEDPDVIVEIEQSAPPLGATVPVRAVRMHSATAPLRKCR